MFHEEALGREFGRKANRTDLTNFTTSPGACPKTLHLRSSSPANETVEKPLFMMITVPAKRTVKKAVIFAVCRC
jgi:hypothetical protein